MACSQRSDFQGGEELEAGALRRLNVNGKRIVGITGVKVSLRKAGRGLQVLVVESDATIQTVLSQLLLSLGHNVMLAGNGFGGGVLFLISRHDLVIVDLQMPLLNIWELSRIFKERSRRIELLS